MKRDGHAAAKPNYFCRLPLRKAAMPHKAYAATGRTIEFMPRRFPRKVARYTAPSQSTRSGLAIEEKIAQENLDSKPRLRAPSNGSPELGSDLVGRTGRGSL